MSFAVQSDIIGATQFLFAAMVLPTLFDPRAAVSRFTSGATTLGLFLLAGTFLTMGPLWVSFAGSFVCGVVWLGVYLLRPMGDKTFFHREERASPDESSSSNEEASLPAP